MKFKFILGLILLSLINTHTFLEVSVEINAQNNNVGIENDEKCHVVRELENNSYKVICKKSNSEQKIFKNVDKIIDSSTGTPGNLAFSNYIGYRLLDQEKPGLVGSGRRAIFCDGPCKAKE